MIDEQIPRWYAIHTKFKCEKIVLRLLKQKQINVYLPIQKRFRRHGQKMLMSEVPLISCYLFVQITQKDYINVLETDYVMGFVRFAKEIYPIPDTEFNLMRRIAGENLDIIVEKSTFYEGDLVEIASGNLAGLQGKLIEVEGKSRVLVELEHLGFSLQISIERQQLLRI
jgi:transcription antitermination factor NusG